MLGYPMAVTVLFARLQENVGSGVLSRSLFMRVGRVSIACVAGGIEGAGHRRPAAQVVATCRPVLVTFGRDSSQEGAGPPGQQGGHHEPGEVQAGGGGGRRGRQVSHHHPVHPGGHLPHVILTHSHTHLQLLSEKCFQ